MSDTFLLLADKSRRDADGSWRHGAYASGEVLGVFATEQEAIREAKDRLYGEYAHILRPAAPQHGQDIPRKTIRVGLNRDVWVIGVVGEWA